MDADFVTLEENCAPNASATSDPAHISMPPAHCARRNSRRSSKYAETSSWKG